MQKSDKLLKFTLFKILKIGLNNYLFKTKNPPLGRKYQKWCRWQACARGSATAQTKGSRFARSPSPNFAWLCRQTCSCPRKSDFSQTILLKHKNAPKGRSCVLMVPLARIGLATPSLPMTCSTTELQRRQREKHTNNSHKNQV